MPLSFASRSVSAASSRSCSGVGPKAQPWPPPLPVQLHPQLLKRAVGGEHSSTDSSTILKSRLWLSGPPLSDPIPYPCTPATSLFARRPIARTAPSPLRILLSPGGQSPSPSLQRSLAARSCWTRPFSHRAHGSAALTPPASSPSTTQLMRRRVSSSPMPSPPHHVTQMSRATPTHGHGSALEPCCYPKMDGCV